MGDPQVADDMRAWIALNGHIAIESQTRAATLLEHVLGSQGKSMTALQGNPSKAHVLKLLPASHAFIKQA